MPSGSDCSETKKKSAQCVVPAGHRDWQWGSASTACTTGEVVRGMELTGRQDRADSPASTAPDLYVAEKLRLIEFMLIPYASSSPWVAVPHPG